MKTIKRITALLLITVMAFTFAACHEKDEIAVTIGDYEFTSAYYMCVLINSEGEARTRAAEIAATNSSIDTSEDDYFYSVKIDSKDFETWVKDNAIETLKEVAAYKTKCKEANIELDADTKAMAEYYAQVYWTSYGYSEFFEPNGVSLATYMAYMTDTAYVDLYFEHLYGEGGEKEISKEDLTKELTENYALTNMVYVSYSSLTDDEKAEKKETLEKSMSELKSNKKDFETVYYEYNEKPEEETTEDTDTETNTDTETDTDTSTNTNTDTDTETEEEEVLEPMDALASIVGTSETSYAFEKIDDVKKMETGDMQIIDDTVNSRYYLVVKKDIVEDPYYLDFLDITLRTAIAGEEYQEDMEEYANSLKAEINDYAVDRFDVKDIEYPEGY